jgi:hypothetical protein
MKLIANLVVLLSAWSHASAQCSTLDLAPVDLGPDERFGERLSTDGNLAVVGANNGATSASGRAFAYSLQGDGFVLEDELLSVAPTADDRFGQSVAVHGDTILVGATTPKIPAGGFVSVFTRDLGTDPSTSTWSLQAILSGGGAATDPLGLDFGFAVALHGDLAAIGFPADSANGSFAGAVHLYRRIGTSWVLEAVVRPSDGETIDRFGYSVSVRPNLLAVGAIGDGDIDLSAGAVYVYAFNGTGWSLERKVHSPSGGFAQVFGIDVDFDTAPGIFSTYLAVGERRAMPSGAAHIFERTFNLFPIPPSWNLERTVQPSDPTSILGAPSNFGESVSLHGNRLLVGAPRDVEVIGPGFLSAGSAYLYERSSGLWNETRKFAAPDPQTNGSFGDAVDLAGDVALVGARGHDASAGAVFPFPLELASCPALCDDPRLAANVLAGDQAGSTVARNGPWLFVGAPGDDGTTSGCAPACVAPDGGLVRIYRDEGGCWSLYRELRPADAQPGDRFGSSIASFGPHLVVGAPGHDDTATDGGAVFVYRIAGATFPLQQKILPFGPTLLGEFGTAVAIQLNDLYVGQPGNGRVGQYKLTGGSWSFFSSESLGFQPSFGSSLAFVGNKLAVGAPDVGDGRVYVYEQQGSGALAFDAQIDPPGGSSGGRFGASVALSFVGTPRLIVGAPDDAPGGGPATGAVYTYTLFPNFTTFDQTLLAVSPEAGGKFGAAVGARDQHVVVGAPGDGAGVEGAATVYQLSGSQWILREEVRGIGTAASDRFGAAVAVEQGAIVVGAPGHGGGSDAGLAFAFEPFQGSRSLVADRHAVSASNGGLQSLHVNAGPAFAGDVYWMLGSVTGSSPGIPFTGGVIPLQLDIYTKLTIKKPFLGSSVSFLGLLDPNGRAAAGFTLVAGGFPDLIGVEFTHAYVLAEFLGGPITFASVAESVLVVP